MANENAAPELRTSVQVTVSPMMGTGLPGCSSLTARTLVTTSSTSTTDATMSSSFIRRFGFRAVSDSSLTSPIIPYAAQRFAQPVCDDRRCACRSSPK
ncbi:Uncharacterised protein [Mycobacteroides abscessus subsp. abscessus]|nr:Uncharacterised protein [Mycobacteroides abscessus]SIL69333.1 Uncharacterised protein [Mycobacteroides abscessus subsp. abscessus]